MSLLDKLNGIRDQPADADLLGYLGIRPGDPLAWDADKLIVGNESIPMPDVKAAMRRKPDPNRRTVKIGDL